MFVDGCVHMDVSEWLYARVRTGVFVRLRLRSLFS
jgi:hypothetical protein